MRRALPYVALLALVVGILGSAGSAFIASILGCPGAECHSEAIQRHEPMLAAAWTSVPGSNPVWTPAATIALLKPLHPPGLADWARGTVPSSPPGIHLSSVVLRL